MRITSLNLRGFFDWEHRMPLLVAYLREVAPDVVLLQEVVHLPEISPFSPAALLNDELGLPVRHESITRLQRGRRHALYREGLAVLARWPIPSSESLVLRHEAGDPHQRIVQFVDVEHGGRVWPLVNVHLSVRDDFALAHLGEVLGVIRDRGQSRILGGDFNVDHLEQHAELWRGGTGEGSAVLTSEVADYQSHPSSHENDDYFLVPAAYRIDRVLVSGDELSDHRAVTVDLSIG